MWHDAVVRETQDAPMVNLKLLGQETKISASAMSGEGGHPVGAGQPTRGRAQAPQSGAPARGLGGRGMNE